MTGTRVVKQQPTYLLASKPEKQEINSFEEYRAFPMLILLQRYNRFGGESRGRLHPPSTTSALADWSTGETPELILPHSSHGLQGTAVWHGLGWGQTWQHTGFTFQYLIPASGGHLQGREGSRYMPLTLYPAELRPPCSCSL